MKLVDMKQIKGQIVLKSGLHIGSGDMEMKIGGIDNSVIKHPHTQEPFIPGSSLKGKVRSLLEMRSGLMIKTEGKPISVGVLKDCDPKETEQGQKILQLFGASGADDTEMSRIGPTRVSFADAYLNEDWKRSAEQQQLVFTEVKSENSINRIKGTAENPRFTERVPAGTRFDFCVTLKIMDGDGALQGLLLEGLKLLQMDALGGSGSRGYGKIEFEFDDKELQARFDEVTPL